MLLQLRSVTMSVIIIVNLYSIYAVKAQDVVKQAPKPEPPKIIRKSGGLLQGTATKRIEPIYPPQAMAVGVGGQVIMEVIIDEEGKPISARTVFGHPLLRDAVVETVYGWVWPPTTLSGVPVKVIGRVTFLSTGSKAVLNQRRVGKEQSATHPYFSERAVRAKN